MAWNYNWQAGPSGGSLTTLSTYCQSVRLLSEGPGSGLRGLNVSIPYLHGTRAIDHKFYGESTLLLEVVLRYTNGSGAVVHSDGAAGHVYENLSEVKRLLTGQRGLATLQRTTPDWGTVSVDVEQIGLVYPSQNRFTFVFPLNAPTPFWQSTSQSSQNPSSPITPNGDGPIDNMWVEFSGGSNASLTHSASGAQLSLSGSTPGGGIRIYVGEGRAEYISGGADATSLVSANRSYWMEMVAGASNAFTVGGGTTATVKWYDRWRL